MSRSEYSEDLDSWALIRWRGAVTSAIRGKRGQQFLADLLSALDEMPNKRLITYELELEGEFCALGVLGQSRNIDMSEIDPMEYEEVSHVFNIAEALAREVVFENDAGSYCEEMPEKRWSRMRHWAISNLRVVNNKE